MGGYGQSVTGNLVSGYDTGNLLFGVPFVKVANSNGAADNLLDWHLPFEVYLPSIRFIR